ncbi:hypothetical protein [Psychroflexus sp. MES1-P1E]|uniref:hypothetical protein n=1 Tax=Psychroflexus sp. MES1-P1E TaxID=2058320 RepID=UPI000C7D0C18|nr:hypothetical protein [Psychroflexus sp. MES1-P1E]PKG41607.1 hypothetical protein CXF67_14695 [Psychroflexus sp. MES1-P1E]
MKDLLFTVTIISFLISFVSLKASVISSNTEGDIVNNNFTHNVSVSEKKTFPVNDIHPVLNTAEWISFETFCATQSVADLISLYDNLIAQKSTANLGQTLGT